METSFWVPPLNLTWSEDCNSCAVTGETGFIAYRPHKTVTKPGNKLTDIMWRPVAGKIKKQNKKKLVLLPRQTHAHINVNDHGDGSGLLFVWAAARCELSPEVCLRFVFKGAGRGRVRTACLCTPQRSLASPPASWRRLTKHPAITERIISSWSAVLWLIRMQMTVTMILHQLIVDWELRLYNKHKQRLQEWGGELL